MSNFIVKYTYQMIDRLTPQMGRMSSRANRMGSSLRRMGKDADYADSRLHRLARTMRNMRTAKFGLGGTMTTLGGGLLAHRVGSTLIDYEKAMNKVFANVVSSANIKDGSNPILKGFENAKNPILESALAMKALRDETQRVAQISIFDPTQVAGGLLELVRSGLKTQDALTMLHPVMRLAGAGDLDPSSAVDIATNITMAFDRDIKSAADTVDILAMAASNANTDVKQLGQAMKFAAPTAKVAGRSLEETTGLLMSLAKRGFKDTLAGTTVARMLESIYKRSGPAVKALKSIGLAHSDFMTEGGYTIPIAEMLEKFRAAAEKEGIGREKVIMAIDRMMGSRGGRGAKLLFETAAEEVRANEALLKMAKNRAELMETLMMSGIYGAFEKMRAALVTAVIKLGEGGLADDLSYLAGKVKEFADWFSALPDPIKKWVGRVLIALTALSMAIIPLGIFAIALKALLPIFMALFSPISLVAMGLAALGVYLANKYDVELDGVISAFKAFGDAIAHPLESLEKLANFSFGRIRDGVRSMFPESWLRPIDGSSVNPKSKLPENYKSTWGKVLDWWESDNGGKAQTKRVSKPLKWIPKGGGSNLNGARVDEQQATKVDVTTSIKGEMQPLTVTVQLPNGMVIGQGTTTGKITDKGRTQVESAIGP